MIKFKDFLELNEGYDIPINSLRDINSFETNLNKIALKKLFSIIRKNGFKDIVFAGDEHGNIKLRGGMEIEELNKFKADHNFNKKTPAKNRNVEAALLLGKGTVGKKAGAGNPGGAEWEGIIVAAYNMKTQNTDLNNAIKLGEISKWDNKKLSPWLPVGKKIVDNAFKRSSAKMTHYGSGSGTIKDEWNKIFIDMTGRGAPASTKTPKTDMYIGKQHISLKKKGGSQLMSGGKAEALATVTFAYNNMPTKLKTRSVNKVLNELKSDIEKEFTKVKLPAGKGIGAIRKDIQGGTRSQFLKKMKTILTKSDKAHDKMTSAIRQLTEIPEFKNNMVKEAMTGKNKFSDNLSVATHLLVFNENGNAKYTKIDDSYIKQVGMKTKFNINFKKSSGSAFTSLRGAVSEDTIIENILTESFMDTETEFLTEGIISSITNFISRWVSKFIDKISNLIAKGLKYLQQIFGISLIVNNPIIVY